MSPRLAWSHRAGDGQGNLVRNGASDVGKLGVEAGVLCLAEGVGGLGTKLVQIRVRDVLLKPSACLAKISLLGTILHLLLGVKV